jgi:hypothetical protein
VSIAVPDEPPLSVHEAEAAQAAYYRAVLVERRGQLDGEIAKRRRDMEQHIVSRDTLSRLRRELRLSEAEYRDVERLILALDRRFLAVFN